MTRSDFFEPRHHGKSPEELQSMLTTIGVQSLDELIDQTIPSAIRLPKDLNLPEAETEFEYLKAIKEVLSQNVVAKSYIGQGYYGTYTPNVILRNILENPAWYTAYTPYQAEIAQGRLEMLLNYQTLVIDLTGLELANASLLDEATAAAEAAAMLFATKAKTQGQVFFVSELCHPQTIDVLVGRAKSIGFEVEIGAHENIDLQKCFGVLVQYPATNGQVIDYTDFICKCAEVGVKTVVAADILSLTHLKSPGEMGADVAVGSTQRLGVPMGYGGPHAGYFATKESYKRQIPGRIIGVSVDATGQPALRMALQTREQHIRREKATSNICTAQVLLSVMAAAYAVYHGPDGLKNISQNVGDLAASFDASMKSAGFETMAGQVFDTVAVKVPDVSHIRAKAEESNINFRYNIKDHVLVSFDETKTMEDLQEVLGVFGVTHLLPTKWEPTITRNTSYLTAPVFKQYHTEHEMLRYLKRLESKDLSMVHSMISLGSCTMKLNATAEMIPVTWPELGHIHPFAPAYQAVGYQQLLAELGQYLQEITGFSGISFQPNSGAQGEYAGLMVIKAYLENKGQAHRNIALIPASAHGTNPASAAMAGMKVVVVKCDEAGNIDVADLKAKLEVHKEQLAALMVTYPSTHGVFEESIIEICQLIHQAGGQVYMDGANMNAQVGLTSPGFIGADVCHLNLHKTFCIPHGGGGPGMGPIGVAAHLVPFLPGHIALDNAPTNIHAISAGPFGSASILVISHAYIRMMGAGGLKNATKNAILNANYIKDRLKDYYEVLYLGSNGRCAHEMIVDLRIFKNSAKIEAEDVAKRLMDYGFHAPTLSFPVAGTLMIEPTESETQSELDRFCDALIEIRKEILEIETGLADAENNVLKNAPHTAEIATADQWPYVYTRQKAVYPLPYLKVAKFWPAVSRIDGAHGDRNLVCSCTPISEYIEETT